MGTDLPESAGYPGLSFRPAGEADLDLLAEWNHQLIRDEGHRNPMNVPQLRLRMQGWLEGEYRAVIFELEGEPAAYGLYRQGDGEIYLRQLFVRRDLRRKGIGRQAVQIFREQVWSHTCRLTVEVLTANQPAVHFWRAVGFRDYSLLLEILPEGEDRLLDG